MVIRRLRSVPRRADWGEIEERLMLLSPETHATATVALLRILKAQEELAAAPAKIISITQRLRGRLS